MSDFNLKYTCRETGKVFVGKGVARDEVRVMDPDTGKTENLSRYMITKRFISDPENKTRAIKANTPAKRPRRFSKKFREYLNGVSA